MRSVRPLPSVWNRPGGAAGLSSLPGLDPTAILSIDTTNDSNQVARGEPGGPLGLLRQLADQRPDEVVAGVERRHRAEAFGNRGPRGGGLGACVASAAPPGSTSPAVEADHDGGNQQDQHEHAGEHAAATAARGVDRRRRFAEHELGAVGRSSSKRMSLPNPTPQPLCLVGGTVNARFVAGSTMTETTAWTTARPKKTEAVTAWVSRSTNADTASAPTNDRLVATSHGRATRRSRASAPTR